MVTNCSGGIFFKIQKN